MAMQLGPGGRGLLILCGLGLLGFGAVRAGWLSLGGLLEPDRTEQEGAPPRQQAVIWQVDEEPCAEAPRIAAPPRAAAAGLDQGVRLSGVAHGGAGLQLLSLGQVDGAVASVAEVAAAWGSLPPDARIASLLGGGRDLAFLATEELDARALAGRLVAAPEGSAEAFLVQAATEARVEEVEGSREALQLLGGGRVAAAVVPMWQAGAAGPVGRPAAVRSRTPVDPVVLVASRQVEGCVAPAPAGEAGQLEPLRELYGERPAVDTPPRAGELIAAWAAARLRHRELPPLELVITPALASWIHDGPREPLPEPGTLAPALAPSRTAEPGELPGAVPDPAPSAPGGGLPQMQEGSR